MLNKVTRVSVDGKEVFLIGTAHVSKESVELVRETIEKESPDVVAVELCEQRHHAIAEKKRWDETEISKVIKEGKGYLFLAQLFLTNFQRRIGDELGVKPGSEMVAAMHMAKERNIRVALVDRDIQVTLKRAIRRMSFFEKARIAFGLMSGMFVEEEDTKKMMEQLKDTDVLTEMMEELGREVPSIKEVLVDERNKYIADRILELEAKKIVVVIGAGHVEGIRGLLSKGGHDIKKEISELERIPEGGKMLKYVGYMVPLSILAIMALAFYVGGTAFLMDALGKWVLLNGGFAALGAALAFAHPYSIITAFLMAPIATLHPLLAVGWFAGIVEAKVRKPRVKDFDDLMKIDSVWDMWHNRVTKILLVMALANLGGTIGNAIAGVSIFAGIIPKIF